MACHPGKHKQASSLLDKIYYTYHHFCFRDLIATERRSTKGAQKQIDSLKRRLSQGQGTSKDSSKRAKVSDEDTEDDSYIISQYKARAIPKRVKKLLLGVIESFPLK